MKTKNYKILTNTEKTIAVIEEYIAFTKKMEAKYDCSIEYNVDSVNKPKPTAKRAKMSLRR